VEKLMPRPTGKSLGLIEHGLRFALQGDVVMESWKRKLRMGMVGGGEGAFIGAVHRLVAALDQQVELVAGCFSRDPMRLQGSGLPGDDSLAKFLARKRGVRNKKALPKLGGVPYETGFNVAFADGSVRGVRTGNTTQRNPTTAGSDWYVFQSLSGMRDGQTLNTSSLLD
jgi:prepilin-type processing-associated H-X9-DG protein